MSPTSSVTPRAIRPSVAVSIWVLVDIYYSTHVYRIVHTRVDRRVQSLVKCSPRYFIPVPLNRKRTSVRITDSGGIVPVFASCEKALQIRRARIRRGDYCR